MAGLFSSRIQRRFDKLVQRSKDLAYSSTPGGSHEPEKYLMDCSKSFVNWLNKRPESVKDLTGMLSPSKHHVATSICEKLKTLRQRCPDFGLDTRDEAEIDATWGNNSISLLLPFGGGFPQ